MKLPLVEPRVGVLIVAMLAAMLGVVTIGPTPAAAASGGGPYETAFQDKSGDLSNRRLAV
ncbi:MAG: hypothetical protein ACRDWW_06110 [Acidimicrobiales bacterium]